MSKKSILILVAIVAVGTVIARGGDDAVTIVISVLLAGAACFVALLVLAIPVTIVDAILQRRKLDAAVREYQEIQLQHPHDSKDHCPHRVFTIGQTDHIVLTATDKWCKVCGKHLGVATLHKGFWRNRWE